VRVFAFACHVMWLGSAVCDMAVRYISEERSAGLVSAYDGVGIQCVSII